MWKPDRLAKYLESIIVASTLALLAYVPVMAMRVYLADSEIWSVNLAYHLFEDFHHHWVFSRAIFHSWLALFTGFFSDSAFIFYSARLAMVVNIFAQVFLVHKILRTEVQSRVWHWLGVYLLVSNSFFLTQSFRMRSDLIATTFVLLAVYWMLTKPESSRFKFLILGSALAVLTTPKAIVILPPALILYLTLEKDKKKWLKVFLPVVAIFVIFFGSLFLRLGPLSDLALSLKNYLLETLQGPTNQGAFTALSFTYVIKLIEENKIFAILTVITLFLVLTKYFWSEQRNKIWMSILAYMVLLTIFVPEKVPFLLCSFLPFFVIAITILLSKPILKRGNKAILIVVLAAWVGVTLYLAVGKMQLAIRDDSNVDQIYAMRAVQQYLTKYPDITYYDVIGIVPSRSYLRHFAGPHQPEINRIVAEIIMKEKPDLILKVAKFWFFDSEMGKFLTENYIDIGNGFYLKAFPGPKGKKGKEEIDILAHKEKLAFISPLFEKYQGTELIFKTRDVNKNIQMYLGTVDYAVEQKKSTEILQVSPFPFPDEMPGRRLEELFRFDTQF